ncbi:MAG TPA: hypothetical protein VIM32_01450 [Desulfosporosinus sp.]
MIELQQVTKQYPGQAMIAVENLSALYPCRRDLCLSRALGLRKKHHSKDD